MGLDSRDYARKHRLNFGSSTVSTARVSYQPLYVPQTTKTRWFFLPLLMAVLSLLPLTAALLLNANIMPAGSLGAIGDKVFLAADAQDHYVFFVAAAVLYLLSACLLFGYRLKTVLVFAAFGACGCFLSVKVLEAVWAMAARAQPPVEGSGDVLNGLFFAIRMGYTALERPGNEMIGYIIGVGIAEELAKVLPIAFLVVFTDLSARFKLVAAFALGVGFGLAESILYSERHYNGNAPLLTYIMRFVSLVGLHGMFTAIGAGGLMLARRLPGLQTAAATGQGVEWLSIVAVLGLIPAVLLHGIYDATVGMATPMYALATMAVTAILFATTIHISRDSLAED